MHRRVSDNLPFYVGKGKDKRAWNFHKRSAFWNNTKNKHGVFVEIVFDGLTEDEAFQCEKDTIPELEYELEYGGSKENGIEPLKFTYKPDEAFLKEATKVRLDMGVLINDFFENGQVKDPKGLLKILTQSYAPTNQVLIDKRIEQAVLNDRISRSKSVRNVHNNLYQSVETVS